MISHRIDCLHLSQEDLLHAGCLDFRMAMEAAEAAILEVDRGDVSKYRLQKLAALIVLLEGQTGFPVALMNGTLCARIRIGAMGGLAAKYFAREDASSIGFIGAGDQAKMHLIAMKAARPGLVECRVSATYEEEEAKFIHEMNPLLPNMRFVAANTIEERAMTGADILVTGTRAEASLLKAKWMKAGAFYNHIGGLEDAYVAKQCDKIVCDNSNGDTYANLADVLVGRKPGRETPEERICFSAVGQACVDVAIAHAMFKRAESAGVGRGIPIQEKMIFEHPDLASFIKI
jgi:ornithine cyclodeaminase/alanine dehydrogenase-like protein (mu-crystallin family)